MTSKPQHLKGKKEYYRYITQETITAYFNSSQVIPPFKFVW